MLLFITSNSTVPVIPSRKKEKKSKTLRTRGEKESEIKELKKDKLTKDCFKVILVSSK